MLDAGSDDGAYRLIDVDGDGEVTSEQFLESGRVRRLWSFGGLEGPFTASETGLYHSPDSDAWSDLGVPQDHVYAVVADPNGNRLYAGTTWSASFHSKHPFLRFRALSRTDRRLRERRV